MAKYEGRIKAIERKLPREDIGDMDIELGNEDGTITTEDGRRLQPEDYKREMEARGETVILVGYPETEEEKREDEERARRWHEWRKSRGLE